MKVVSLGVKADEEETGVSSASSGLGLGKELELEDGRRNEGAEDPKQLSDVAAAEDSPEAVEVAVANAAEAGGMRVTEFVIAGKEVFGGGSCGSGFPSSDAGERTDESTDELKLRRGI